MKVACRLHLIATLSLGFAVLASNFTSQLAADERLPGGHYILKSVDVKAIERTKKGGKTNDHESEKLTHWIRFDIHPKFELLKGTAELEFKMVNRADDTRSRLTFDKPIKFEGETVPAGTNLLDYKKFDGSFFNVHMPAPFPFAIHSATIKSGFEIPADKYAVKFEWTTKEGTVFSDTVDVFIDVKLK